MRFRIALPMLAAVAALVLPAAEPERITGDEQDLVVLHPARPYRLRLHLQVDGHSFRQNFDDMARRLFRYLDTDGDGVLSDAEAARAPSAVQWTQLLQGVVVVDPDPPPEPADLRGGAAGPITPATFAAYYRRQAGGPLRAEWGPPADPGGSLGDVLFQLLDSNGDGKLSRDELQDAAALLTSADLNGDELVDGDELSQALARMKKTASTPAARGPASMPFLLADPTDPPGTLVNKLLAAYDRDGDRHLSPKEIAFDPELFKRLDANHDGRLDRDELATWRDLPPDLEAIVPLRQGWPRFHLLGRSDGKPGPLGDAVRLTPDGTLFVRLPGMRLEALPLDATMPFFRPQRDNSLAPYLGRGKDFVLDNKQIFQPPFTLVGLSRLADRNDDGKLTGQEIADYLAMADRVVTGSTFVTATNRGRSLFELLDANGDRRLSRRELMTAWQRLAEWDQDGDGSLSRDELPRQYLLAIGHGRPPFNARDGAGALNFRPPARPRGPLWFRKMDRNGDGDVSRKEFLGSAEQFRRLDHDGDGLISAEEAEAADRELRRGDHGTHGPHGKEEQ
jgi:Ca2+-binding EF-hand superfamily protein